MKAELQPVEVRWVDSAVSRGWHKRTDLNDDAGTTEIRTVGFLTRCDRVAVQVSQSRHITDEKYAMFVGEVLTIPRGCVRKITAIRGLK